MRLFVFVVVVFDLLLLLCLVNVWLVCVDVAMVVSYRLLFNNVDGLRLWYFTLICV